MTLTALSAIMLSDVIRDYGTYAEVLQLSPLCWVLLCSMWWLHFRMVRWSMLKIALVTLLSTWPLNSVSSNNTIHLLFDCTKWHCKRYVKYGRVWEMEQRLLIKNHLANMFGRYDAWPTCLENMMLSFFDVWPTWWLANTMFGWHDFRLTWYLADMMFGQCYVWPMLCLSCIMLGSHDVWLTWCLADLMSILSLLTLFKWWSFWLIE